MKLTEVNTYALATVQACLGGLLIAHLALSLIMDIITGDDE